MIRVHQVCLRVQLKSVFRHSSSVNTSQSWKDAKPYNKIPGPSTFEFIKGFMPGGKYQKLNIIELTQRIQKDYGNLAKFPGILGQKDMIFTFHPNDIETIFRTEGKYPARKGLDTLEYFRGVHRKDWFEKVLA